MNADAPEPGSPDPHKQALRDAYTILAAQFDHLVIVCATKADHATVGAGLDVCWRGGWQQALDLADFAKRQIGLQRSPDSEPGK